MQRLILTEGVLLPIDTRVRTYNSQQEMNTTATTILHGWVHSPSQRGTIDIIWGCVVTVLLCSWSVLCLNVHDKPGSHDYLSIKASWCAFTMFFPEIALAFAQKQWFSAHQSISDFSKLNHPEWCLRHAFFADMGGFVLCPPDYSQFPVNARQIHYLVAKGFMAFPVINREDIWDKSKADVFARLLTSIQVLWFGLQIVGRLVQHLQITTLELDTAAFIFCTLPTFYFWYHKPLDVATPIKLYLNDGVQTRDILLSAGEAARLPFKLTPLDFITSPPDTPYELLDPAIWAFNRVFGLFGEPKHAPVTRFQNTTRLVSWPIFSSSLILSASGIVYLGIRVFAWNFTFPTPLEHDLWRVASMMLLGSGVSYRLLVLAITWKLDTICHLFGVAKTDTITQLFDEMHPLFQYVIAGSWVGCYGLARLCIIIEAFAGVRALPTSAFQTVKWSNFIPHL